MNKVPANNTDPAAGPESGMRDDLARDTLARDTLARLLARGVARHLWRHGLTSLTEVTLPNSRRADLVALSSNGEIWIVEIKSSVEDFRTDRKWQDYLPYCDRFFFASHLDVPAEIFPIEVGYILCDSFDAEIIRHHQKQPMPAPTRKALTIALARLAGTRLLALSDAQGRF